MTRSIIFRSIETKQKIADDPEMIKRIDTAAQTITRCLQAGGRVFFCGNGGSAADAQHLAAELSGRFYLDRPPLPAEAVHTNTSFITAVSNDYSFTEAYARYIRAHGKAGDTLIAISTSGTSGNILKAVECAKEMKMTTIGLTGITGGKMKNMVDLLLAVPSDDTPRIQEAHILIGHIICEIIERNIFGKT